VSVTEMEIVKIWTYSIVTVLYS